MTEQIRADLERECRTRMTRPKLRVTAVEPIPEGHSGFTYFVSIVDDGDAGRYVLRLPPPNARIAGPADVVRQGRIMAALHAAGLPTPAIPAQSSDPVVDGRPFILMEAVEGTRIEKAGIEHKPIDIAGSAVDVLKRLHALPLAQTGIGDEEPVGLQAEMMRWAWLMQRAPEELTARAGDLGGLLAGQLPAERAPTLVHGDYHYGNMLFRGADVVAVLDWEIAQIGQSLLDLGCLCIVSIRRQYQGAPNPGGAIDVSVQDLYRLYDVEASEMRWYAAMSLYKYAAIFGYNLMLHRRGKRPDPMYEGLTDTIVGMIDEGITLLDHGV
ncbi:MAG TPA: phosphotransferase family protein [Candidatus Baltobacterales bacterium]|nr:phosphotransferase family protein [Candidatus Baltobacterales bacterium]